VTRDGSDEITTGVALNIHRGGWKTTSSLGCQTIHPAEWTAFHALVHHALKNTQLKRFWYILTEGPIT
jgi:lysozyme